MRLLYQTPDEIMSIWVSLYASFKSKKRSFRMDQNGKENYRHTQRLRREGDTAYIQSGKDHLKLRIVRKEYGKLEEVITQQNYKLVIPTAKTVQDAIDYLQDIYGKQYGGTYTAYYLEKPKKEPADQ